MPISEKEFGEPMEALSSTNVPLTTSLATCHSLIKVKGKLVGYSVDKKMFESTGFELEDGPPGVNPTYGVETPFIVKSNASEVAVLLRFPFEASVKRMTVRFLLLSLLSRADFFVDRLSLRSSTANGTMFLLKGPLR